MTPGQPILKETEKPAVEVHNPGGAGPCVLVCEHASCAIPAALGTLGLRDEDRKSHAVWDPGAFGVACALSALLDAPLVAARYSRLVYDCNRPPEAPSAMPERTELVEVPGNAGLDAVTRQIRVGEFYIPFTRALAGAIAAHPAPRPALVTIHSFNPTYFGRPREVELGILHDSDSRLADALLAALPGGGTVRRNSPYGPEDGVTHTLRVQGVDRGLPNVMIEIRNDLIATETEQRRMAADLAEALKRALAGLAASAGEVRIRTNKDMN